MCAYAKTGAHFGPPRMARVHGFAYDLREGQPTARADAMMTPAQARGVVSFGPFNLIASERRLTKNGAPVELGARSLDILIALLSKANEVIRKEDLLAQV